MNDFINQELSVGDNVLFIMPKYSEFRRGVVVSFTPRMVKIQPTTGKTICRYSKDVVKIELIVESSPELFI